MDKLARMALLYDFYSSLLTDKQRDSLDLYYQQDFSLAEIAEECGISRQAVHDLLKRSEHILLDYEARLKLVEKYLERQAKLLALKDLLRGLPLYNAPMDQIGPIIDDLLSRD
ncbi:MAG: YlxM family DNA-binding protein [Peptococcaceae bacterium]|nr:YlxM family DNA-binding protein [Peptococcaceae bacterium]